MRLTPRQLDLARLVHAGRSNKQIASDLSLTYETVKVYLCKIYRRLEIPAGVNPRSALVRYVAEHPELFSVVDSN